MDSLDVSPSQFRELARQTTEILARYLEGLPTVRSFPVTSGVETERLFGGSIPEEGMGSAALDLLPEVLRHSCPRSPPSLAMCLARAIRLPHWVTWWPAY